MKLEHFFRHPLGIVITAFGATLLWGSAFPMIKLGYLKLCISPGDIFEQILFASYRFTVGGILIFAFMLMLRQNLKLAPGSINLLLKISIVQTFLQYLFLYIGLSQSSSMFGAIVAGAISLFQLVIAHFIFKGDRLNLCKVIGLLLGFTGLFLLFSRGAGSFHFGLGEALLLLAAFMSASGNIFSKVGADQFSVLYINAYQMLIGGLCLVAVASSQVGFLPFEFHKTTLLILLYLSFISAAGFVLWNYLMKYNEVGNLSMFLFLVPLFGIYGR